MLRQFSSLQYAPSSLSTRASAEELSNTRSNESVGDAQVKNHRTAFPVKFQDDVVNMTGSPSISAAIPVVSSNSLTRNNIFSPVEGHTFFDPPSVSTCHMEFNHDSLLHTRHNVSSHVRSLSSVTHAPDASGGVNPSVELPVMASFPQSDSNAVKVPDRVQHCLLVENEPSSFLRSRVQTLQQRLPNKISPGVQKKYSTMPLASRSEDSGYLPFHEKKEHRRNSFTQYQLSETTHHVPSTTLEKLGSASLSTTATLTSEQSHLAPPVNTRAKLSTIQDKIVRFEGQLQLESKQKKAAEENRLQVLCESISTVEKTLNAEVRRRLETMKTIQTNFETQLQNFHTHIERSITEKQRQINDDVESIASRLHGAEKRVDALHDSQNTAILKLTEDIERATADIRTLKDHLENELKARRQREAILLDRLGDVEKQIESRIALERGMREKEVLHLKCSLENIHDNHVALDEAFQQSLASTFHELKTNLRQESQAREQADDDIVQALNHYTAALQKIPQVKPTTKHMCVTESKKNVFKENYTPSNEDLTPTPIQSYSRHPESVNAVEQPLIFIMPQVGYSTRRTINRPPYP